MKRDHYLLINIVFHLMTLLKKLKVIDTNLWINFSATSYCRKMCATKEII
jgi:hypothetical protein